MKKRILCIAADLTVAALVVLAVWIANYKIPQRGIKAATFPQMEAGEENQSEVQKQTKMCKRETV